MARFNFALLPRSYPHHTQFSCPQPQPHHATDNKQQPMATSVSQRWHDAARLGMLPRPSFPGSGDGAAAAAADGGGDPSNPFLAGADAPQRPRDDNPFLSGSPGRSGGGGGGYDPSNPFAAPSLQQQHQQRYQQQPPSPGSGGDDRLAAGTFTSSLLRGVGAAGSGAATAGSAEALGSLLDGASQTLRGGVAYVAKWLAARIVWWDMRGEWCELLYRHRVCNTRMDFVEERLAAALVGLAQLLPPRERLVAAGALLKEAAAALERCLLDGGAARVFVPADVELISADVAALKQLFHAEGDGLGWQEVDSALARVGALLQLMAAPTQALVQRHMGLRRSGGGATAALAPAGSPGASPKAGAFGTFSPGSAGGAGATPPRSLTPPRAGSSLDPAYRRAGSALSTLSASPVPAALFSGGGAGAGAGAAASDADPASDEQAVLRVLCHRADHAASKYLKDCAHVPKLREETLKEAVGRLFVG